MAAHLTASETDYVFSGKRNHRKAKVNATPYLLNSTGKIKSAEEKDQIGAALISGDIAPCDFFSQVEARRVPLPGYCFDRVRCWIDAPQYQEAQLPLYQHQWCPLLVNTTIANSCLSEKALSVGELAFQAIEIVEYMTHKQATNCLLLNDDDLDRARIVNYLLDIGSFLHQLDEALERPVTLVLLSRHSAWLEGEDTSTTADIISMIWAAMKSASHELVNIKLHWLDVSRDTSQLQLKQSLSYLVSADKAGVELVQRSNQLMHSVIVPHAESCDYPAAKIQENDAVILAGGNGGLGQYLQDYYLSLGIKHLIIISRRSSEKGVNREIPAPEQQGINFYRITGDAGQKYVWHDIAQLVEERNLNVNAICHLAGVLSDAPVSGLTEENIANVISPKSDTCSRIEEMLHVLKPRSIFLYSSLSAATGSPAQFAYAAANACLDAWARKLKRKGFNVKSIQWGPWAGEGMAARGNHRVNNTCRIREISASEGIKSFESIIADDTAAVYLAARLPVEESKFTHGKSTWMELGHQLFSHKSSESMQLRTEPKDKSSQLDFGTLLTELVREMVGLPYENVDFIKMTFSALGLDSLAMTHLRKRIASEAGVSLTIGELYSYPTVSSLTEHINHKSVQDPVAGSSVIRLQKRDDQEAHEREKLVAEICQLLC
ncbi:beta-ketoacyl reductase [Photorhabdus heterorhabditis]|uniref:beta-ketoacyl reductase n=1 Tax=Photorhabdus heterorhabditis TaxID=880156 RepID=UPI001561B4E6|nr:beta-ketoacyl reductase [Photorhabdus heterorhabditis]NRN30486.1 SDR family NAD(P)-dependent oxidoreductase [Photorhabdus heterorhabditis subsp. aluminescens]